MFYTGMRGEAHPQIDRGRLDTCLPEGSDPARYFIA